MRHLLFLIPFFLFSSVKDEPMVRFAEIEILPGHLETYLKILNEEAKASLEKEEGVLCILPTVRGNHVRILEVYASEAAYRAHLQSSHFLHYKKATAEMIKSLELIDVEVTDKEILEMVLKK